MGLLFIDYKMGFKQQVIANLSRDNLLSDKFFWICYWHMVAPYAKQQTFSQAISVL